MTNAKPRIASSPVSYNIGDMPIEPNGVRDFFWPVPYPKRNDFCMSLIDEYTKIVQAHDNESSLFCYKIMAKYFVTEAITIFWADALVDGFNRHGENPALPPRLTIWRSAFSSAQFPQPRFLNTFRHNSASKKSGALKKLNLSFIKKVLALVRLGKGGAKIDNMSLKRITPHVLKTNIISTQRTPIVSRHALCEKKDVVFCRSERWFSQVSETEIETEAKYANTSLENEVINSIENLYKKAQVPFSARAKEHLSNVLKEGASLIRIHEKRLADDNVPVPSHLWTGTAGYCWDTILRNEVSRRGGRVIGHDHGAGQAHVDNPITGFTEFWSCDEYVTYNNRQAAELSSGATKWPQLDKSIPDITGVADSQKSRPKIATYNRFNAPHFRVKNIAFLATIYDGDRGRMGPSSPDIVHIDWQARLISQLKSWGYNVIIKIHPESAILPPDIFTEQFGARVETRKVEDVLDDLDLLLFDSVYTTALYAGLKTNTPMALIDFYDHPWTEKGRNLFEKRSYLQKGWFDYQNRKQVDWAELQRAIQVAPNLNNNHQFFDYYYA